MARLTLMFFAVLLAACAPSTGPTPLGADGRPLPRRYTIELADRAAIQLRMLDAVNSLRQAAGQGPVQFDSSLNAAAATHARDMAVQNRPWHFGSDGSSPLDRARRVGFMGPLSGEVISETYETELQTLAAWVGQADTKAVLMDPKARLMGFDWFQESTGKIWWVLVLGG